MKSARRFVFSTIHFFFGTMADDTSSSWFVIGLGIEGDIEVMNQEMYPDTLDEPVLMTFVFLTGTLDP